MSLESHSAKSLTAKYRTPGFGTTAVRAVVTARTEFAASALSSLAAAPAHADPGICIDHVIANGHEAASEVLQACEIASYTEQTSS